MSNKDDVQVGIVADTSGIEASIKKLESVMTKFSTNVTSMGTNISEAMNGIDSAIGRLGKTSTSSSAKVTGDLKAIEAQAKKTNVSLDANGKLPQADARGRLRTPTGQFANSATVDAKQTSMMLLQSDISLGQTLKVVKAREAEKAATVAAEKATANKINTDASARYALYDIAAAYGAVSAAIVASTVYVVKASADMESAFTGVERTASFGVTTAQINDMRKALIDLSTEIPKTFAEVSQIATLGNQLGVAQGDLVEFTKTVSEFSVTTGISVEATAQAFGLLGNLLQVPVAQFKNLASSIALVGVSSVATEPQIIAVAQQIAAAANGAGFAADEVIGLSGALASLKVSPEQGRSSLTTYFGVLNKAVAAGGDDLEKFATITGYTAQELDSLVRSGTGGEEVFTRFLKGLNSSDSVGVTKALDDLGLAGLRVDNTFRRLSQNPGVVSSAFKDANDGFVSGTEASRQYALVADDLNEAFIMLSNSVNNLIGQLGQDMVPAISMAATELKNLIKDVTDFSATSFGKGVFTFITALSALTGILVTYKTISLLAAATTLAFARAQVVLAGTGGAGSISTLFKTAIPQILGLTTATGAATVATTGLTVAKNASSASIMAGSSANVASTVSTTVNTVAITAQSRAAAIGAATMRGLGLAIYSIPGWGWALAGVAALFALGSALGDTYNSAGLAATGLTNVAQRAADGGRDIKQLAIDAGITANALGLLEEKRIASAAASAAAAAADDRQRNSFRGGGSVPSVEDVGISFGAAIITEQYAALDKELASIVNSGNFEQIQALLITQGVTASVISGNLGQYTAALAGAKREAATVASDKFESNLENSRIALADAEKQVKSFGGSAGGAAKQVRTLSDYAGDLASIFKRSFSIRFDSQSALDDITSGFSDLKDRIDAARTSLLSLSADKSVKEYFLSIANAYGDTLRAGLLTAEIAKINSDIADTQANASTELQGNSAAAIKNRSTVRGMVGSYDSYIKALAESGASQETLRNAINQGRADFIAQATQLGFSSAQLGIYTQHFDDLAVAVNSVPRNITVTANTNPALQALNEFVAKSAVLGGSAGSSYGNAFAEAQNATIKAGHNKIIRDQMAILQKQAYMAESASEWRVINNERLRIQALLIPGFSTGGYTGSGGKFDVAGLVHKGEYVVPKSQVNQSTGMPYEGALSQMKNPTYFNGGPVSGNSGMMVVSLSPEDRGLLRQIGGSGQVVLYANNEAIARSSSAGSKAIIATGGRL
jgi:TP901 family phage tail tape measure protein